MPNSFKSPESGTPASVGESFGLENNDIFYAAIQRSRMPMLLTDPNEEDNPVVFCNDSFMKLTGYTADEVLGRNCRFLQGKETDKGVVSHISDAIAAEEDVAVEILNYKKDGTPFWNALYISPVYNNDGKLVYFFASQLDITRRVRSEDMLRQSQKLETIGQLTGGIAHDFNNMLTVVMGNLKMAQTGIQKGHDVSAVLERAMAAARHSDKLTQQLLSFARKQRMEIEKISMNVIVSQVQALIERVIPPQVTVSVDLSTEPCSVRVDRAQAESAVLNVLINARDALPEKGGTIKLKVRPYISHGNGMAAGNYVCLSIEDNGRGMSEDTKQRIFEPFFTTKAVGQGTGMGMAMVHGFAEQSGAVLKVESSEGKGTTILFYFPAADNVDEEADAPNNSTRILLVEDNNIVRETTVDYLRMNGFTVRHAESGIAGLEILESGYTPDIVFSDIIMPGQMNGVEMARHVRERYPHIKILLTSGWTNDLETAKEFDIMSKPYDLDKLSEVLGAMATFRSAQEHQE